MPVEQTYDPEKVTAILVEETANEVQAAAIHLVGLTSTKSPVGASGNLAQSFGIRTQAIGGIGKGVEIDVASKVDYASYVELDTRPHWPPLEPLYRYVDALVSQGRIDIKVGNASSKSLAAKRRYLPRTFSRARQVYAVARAIQRKIAAKGTQGQHMLTTSFREMGIVNVQMVVEGGEVVYVPDLTPWLLSRQPGIWARVEQRLNAA